jgi:phytoene synthase
MMAPEDSQTSFTTVRANDPDRYLTALMAPRRVRESLMALYAFNSELARIPQMVSEPAFGEFRLQWWRDVLERKESTSSMGAPVADALGKAFVTHGLPKPLLLGMIDARIADLDGGGFADLQALKAYLYKSEGAVFALSMHILNGKAPSGSVANSAGLATGMTHLLRMLARDLSSNRVMLPLSMLDEHSIPIEQLLAGQGADELNPVLVELAGEARTALEDAHKQIAMLETGLRPAFAPLALVEPYLKAMERPDHHFLQDIADINPLVRFWKLWRAR